jgi:hypothetical protein
MGSACYWPRPSSIRAAFRGTCDRAANWIAVGATRGVAKSNDTDVAHGASKRIWVFPLHRHARLILSSPLPHPALPHQEVKPMTLTEADATALFARLEQLDDPRGTRGRRHAQRSLVATIRCAVVSGAQDGPAISAWGPAAQPRDAAAAALSASGGRPVRAPVRSHPPPHARGGRYRATRTPTRGLVAHPEYRGRTGGARW